MKNLLSEGKFIIVFLLVAGVMIACFAESLILARENRNSYDIVSYNGKTYVTLQYNADIFTYFFNADGYYDEESVQPVSHDKWDVVYCGGDLFVNEKQAREAEKYFADDANYQWFAAFDEDDAVRKVPLTISKEELEFLYNIEDVPRSETVTFDEINQFADIMKISNDGLVYAVTTLAQCNDAWYWKTEVIDDSREDNAEYVIKLPDSLCEKLFALSEQ